MADAPALRAAARLPDWRAGVQVRRVREADLPEMEWEGEYAHFRRVYRQVYERSLKGRALMWVADLPGIGLVGQVFVQMDGRKPAYVHGFRVRPEFRGQGLGGLLMDVLEDDLARRGIRLAALNVVDGNAGARRFYERRGYRVVAADPGQWTYIDQYGVEQEVNEPGWRMMKKLGDGR
ncbi:MAG: GNAT family N-acetyltransferase [Chloroflexi bacterium]|nr:GNAT family N-acetyltransferase [Chloroflexota bacterium]